MRRRTALAVTAAALPAALLAACAAPGAQDLAEEPVRVVFFEDDSIALGPPAMRVVEDAAGVAARHPRAPVQVLGFVAPDPAHAPIAALARARAEHVAAELARLGVARGRIEVRGRGAAAFSDLPLESRRVEIRVGRG